MKRLAAWCAFVVVIACAGEQGTGVDSASITALVKNEIYLPTTRAPAIKWWRDTSRVVPGVVYLWAYPSVDCMSDHCGPTWQVVVGVRGSVARVLRSEQAWAEVAAGWAPTDPAAAAQACTELVRVLVPAFSSDPPSLIVTDSLWTNPRWRDIILEPPRQLPAETDSALLESRRHVWLTDSAATIFHGQRARFHAPTAQAIADGGWSARVWRLNDRGVTRYECTFPSRTRLASQAPSMVAADSLRWPSWYR